jgi:hypothetical protein
MTDLIERLEEVLWKHSTNAMEDKTIEEAITALREQEEVLNSFREVMTNEGLKTRQELQARIAELEDERMDAAMLDQYRIWYAKEEAKVKRLDAALAEIIMLTGLDNPLLERAREIALKARAGDGD